MRIIAFYLLVSSLLTLISCSPKDEKLIRPDSNSKVKTESNAADDLIRLSFVAFDKQAEAFHFLKAVLNKDYAIQNKLVVEMISEQGFKTVMHITSTEVHSETDKYLQSFQIDLLAVITRDDLKNILEVVIKDNAAGKSNQNLFIKESGRLANTPTLFVTNKSKLMIFTAAAAGTFGLETDSVDLLLTRNKKNSNEIFTDLSAVSSRSVFIWDEKGSLLNEKIKMLMLSFNHIKTTQVKSEMFLISDNGLNLFIDLGPCVPSCC